MKIVTFWEGLGNQIIEYAYYLWLKEQCPKDKIFGFYPKAGLKDHNGLEIERHFDIVMPSESIFGNFVGNVLFYLDKILIRMHIPQIFTSTMKNYNIKKVFHCDYWQDIKYIPQGFQLEFRPIDLNVNNKKLLDLLYMKNSVAVHVRRGDYLQQKTLGLYGGICTDSYYEKAIAKILKEVKNPHFIFFSNDAEYCRNTYHLENMIVVDWNTGENSYIDMFLMAHCKYMILANSTFSYCAARFNKCVKQVFCPIKWSNVIPAPNLTLPDWIEVEP